MGSYPESLDESGANIIEPGILIPTTPWECTQCSYNDHCDIRQDHFAIFFLYFH